MNQISNKLCKFTSRLLNVRYLNTYTTPVKLDGVLTFNFLPLLNINSPNIIKNPSIIPIRLPLHGNLNRLIIHTPGLRKTGHEYIDPVNNIEIEAPSLPTADTPKQATRLIVIRRKKMKKHKLRKLRKRRKFEWAKRRQRRELRKEKAFQAGLIMQYKKIETFSAEEYVKSRLEKLEEVVAQERERTSPFKKMYDVKLNK